MFNLICKSDPACLHWQLCSLTPSAKMEINWAVYSHYYAISAISFWFLSVVVSSQFFFRTDSSNTRIFAVPLSLLIANLNDVLH